MCKICVSEGRMTQEELDQANAIGSDAAEGAGARALGIDPAAFLAELFSEANSDPETAAQEVMDNAVKLMLDFVIQEDTSHGVPETAVDLENACERDAGKMMFRCKPGTIALAAVVLARRYAAVLEQWATLYARAAIGDDDTIDLDAAQTAEAKQAVTRATGGIVPEHKTGMYL